jgi:hypothetical protein
MYNWLGRGKGPHLAGKQAGYWDQILIYTQHFLRTDTVHLALCDPTLSSFSWSITASGGPFIQHCYARPQMLCENLTVEQLECAVKVSVH